MPKFELVSAYPLAGDQPKATQQLAEGVLRGDRAQTLLGVTGSGKTMAMARLVELVQKPTLVLSHNKTLAAQLCAEFREFFPNNAVEYFVSYFDYYQPEAYVAHTDTYIAKDSSVNDEIERLRHSATQSLLTRRDTLIVASVSCIFGLGSPSDYIEMAADIRVGQNINRDDFLRKLIGMQYRRNDLNLVRGTFRVRGDTLEFVGVDEELVHRIEFFGDEVEAINVVNQLTGEYVQSKDELKIFPAKHYITPDEKLRRAVISIENELEERLKFFKDNGKLLEAQRLEQRTRYDLDMLREVGYCNGVENYSGPLSGREPGSTPWCLLDFFPKDWLLLVDESHVTLPQVHGMHGGDRSRKLALVEHGFRLPSALDNRPLTYDEFEKHVKQAVYVSATPATYEMGKSTQIVEMIIRPTGLVDPEVEVRPTRHQVDDLMDEIRVRAEKNERVLVTTLTKKMAEDLTDYLLENGIKVRYLHSEVETLERIAILRDLRKGEFDVLVGINLLARGFGLAGGFAGRHFGCRQGRLSALGDVVDPDDRARRAQRRGQGRHVCGRRNRVHGEGARRDEAPARGPGGVQPRARHRAEVDPQGSPRHPEPGRRRDDRRRCGERGARRAPTARSCGGDGQRDRAQDARRRGKPGVRKGGRAARRAGEPAQADRRQREPAVPRQSPENFPARVARAHWNVISACGCCYGAAFSLSKGSGSG